VIITIGIFGQAEVELKNPPVGHRASLILPRERKEGYTIIAGSAYAIWGKARWKMHHDASVGRNERAVEDLRGETARMGLTLRFFRKSFAHVFAVTKGMVAPPTLRESDIESIVCGETIVEALYYDTNGHRVDRRAYPHTYPARPLRMKHVASCDRLSPSTASPNLSHSSLKAQPALDRRSSLR